MSNVKKQTDSNTVKHTLEVADGYANYFKGFESQADSEKSTKYVMNDLVPDNILLHQYYDGGFAAREIECVAEDLLRKGFSITNDSTNIFSRELDRLNFNKVLTDAIIYASVLGDMSDKGMTSDYGAYIYMSVDDMQSRDKPVKINKITNIRFIRAYKRTDVQPVASTKIMDPDDPRCGEYEQYNIYDQNGINFIVHSSRLLKIKFGVSTIVKTQTQLRNLSIFEKTISNLLQEAVIGKYKLENLSQLLASNQENKIVDRMNIIALSKSITNGVLLSENEDYIRDTLNFSGFSGVGNTLMILLSGAAGIPLTRLFGRSPSGLDASGESDLTIYYDKISGLQKEYLTKVIQRLIYYMNTYLHVIPAETEAKVEIVWNSLYQMTAKEEADVYFTNAQADNGYLASGVLSIEEVRRNRFVDGYKEKIAVESEKAPENLLLENDDDNADDDNNDDNEP